MLRIMKKELFSFLLLEKINGLFSLRNGLVSCTMTLERGYYRSRTGQPDAISRLFGNNNQGMKRGLLKKMAEDKSSRPGTTNESKIQTQSNPDHDLSAASRGGASSIGHESGKKNEKSLGSTPRDQVSAGSLINQGNVKKSGALLKTKYNVDITAILKYYMEIIERIDHQNATFAFEQFSKEDLKKILNKDFTDLNLINLKILLKNILSKLNNDIKNAGAWSNKDITF